MKIETAILCENIRQEIGNKLSLMGVYDSSIIFKVKEANVWPKKKSIALYAKLKAEEDEDLSKISIIKVVARQDDYEKIITQLEFDKSIEIRNIRLVLEFDPLVFPKTGLLIFSLIFADNNDKPALPSLDVCRINVKEILENNLSK